MYLALPTQLLMKKSFFFSLLLSILCAGFANSVFAGDPVPGLGIIVRKNPGGEVAETSRTNKAGKFTIALPPGNYDLSIVFNDVVKALTPLKNWDGKSVTLSYQNSEIRSLVPMREVITKNSLPVTITVHKSNVTIEGTFSYEPQPINAAGGEKK